MTWANFIEWFVVGFSAAIGYFVAQMLLSLIKKTP